MLAPHRAGGCDKVRGMFHQANRRNFLKTAAAVTASATSFAGTRDSETLVTTLWDSLSEEQRSKVCFDFDHELRGKCNANWMITPQKIGAFYSKDQQAMIGEIFRNLHSPEFAPSVMRHIQEDGGGIGNYSIALFGKPRSKFEFVLTGRHCTMRCDGDSLEGAAFGGPIMYGHQSGAADMEPADHANNVYWFQAKRANEVFAALSGKQREMALLKTAPRAEAGARPVEFKSAGEFAGLPGSEMSADQLQLVEKALASLIHPFRKRDADEAMRYIKAQGGAKSLSMSFYKNMDIGADGVWDVWQLESANMVWYFRGYPHVHTYVNIRKS